jgi:hypothetical protein
MPEQKHFETCFLCKKSFEFGSDVYRGRQIPVWNIMVCNDCREGNWDGIAPETHPDLISYLKSRNIEATLNVMDLIEWPK